MPNLTPARTAALSRRTGLSFRAVRASRRVPQLIALEAQLDATVTAIAVLRARIRAYKVAIRCAVPSERIELRVLCEQAQRKLERTRLVRDRIKRDLIAVKVTIEAQAFAVETDDVPMVAVPTVEIAPDPDDANERLRRLFNV